MKYFWPRRSYAKGFSIENLSRKYRDKIKNISSNKNQNQLLDEGSLRPIKQDLNEIVIISSLSDNRGHWANRDFSEYRDVA